MCNIERMHVARKPLPLPPPMDTLWMNVNKVIDVFHFGNHVSPQCKERFSPAKLKEENTQAGEQTFVWVSRFQHILCSMSKNHHLFYLHCMVLRWNAYTIKCWIVSVVDCKMAHCIMQYLYLITVSRHVESLDLLKFGGLSPRKRTTYKGNSKDRMFSLLSLWLLSTNAICHTGNTCRWSRKFAMHGLSPNNKVLLLDDDLYRLSPRKQNKGVWLMHVFTCTVYTVDMWDSWQKVCVSSNGPPMHCHAWTFRHPSWQTQCEREASVS